MKNGESNNIIKDAIGDLWFYYEYYSIIVVLGWLFFFLFLYLEYQSKYVNILLLFLIFGSLYLFFAFFRVLIRRSRDIY